MHSILIDLLAIAFLGLTTLTFLGGLLWAIQGEEDVTARWWAEQDRARTRPQLGNAPPSDAPISVPFVPSVPSVPSTLTQQEEICQTQPMPKK